MKKRAIDYIYDLSDERNIKKLLALFKSFGISPESSIVPYSKIKSRYAVSICLGTTLVALLVLILPNI